MVSELFGLMGKRLEASGGVTGFFGLFPDVDVRLAITQESVDELGQFTRHRKDGDLPIFAPGQAAKLGPERRFVPGQGQAQIEAYEREVRQSLEALVPPERRDQPVPPHPKAGKGSCGLLRKSFVPPEDIRVLRSYRRLREDHIERAADSVRHMQKALDLMNIKLHTVVSQLHGVSGMRIVDAILAGERNSFKLTALCDEQILKTKSAAVETSLHGNWKTEHLFALGEARKAWQFYQDRIAACDREIDLQLQKMGGDKPEPPPREDKVKPIRHNAPQIDDLDVKLRRLTDGIDATRIPGFTDRTVLQLVAEIGLEMSRWATAGHFTSWLGLAPGLHQSGRKKKTRRGKKKTQAGQIFRLMAQSVGQSKFPALGGFYRRIRARRGASVAIVATARKLAVLYWHLMRFGTAYVEQGLAAYEEAYRQTQLKRLQNQASRLGFTLTPQPA